MYRILIVDDDTFTLDMYTVKFGEAGDTVDSAKSPEEALQRLEDNEEYDAVLLDVVMPDISGLDLIEKIKKEKLGGDSVCIVLSNHGEPEDINRAMAAGASEYILKAHLVPSMVVQKVHELLKESKK